MQLRSGLGHIHAILGRSNTLTRLARHIRNQANCVVSSHFSEINGSISDPRRYNEYRLIDLIAPSARNFIDVGANIGLWSSRFIAAMKQPAIGLVFEPNLECFEKLRIEHANHGGVKVLRAAISDYIGTATFYEDKANSEFSSLSPHDACYGSPIRARASQVPVTTLDREVIALGWDSVSMIKIDAEGEDLFSLRGARQILKDKIVDFVQFECNSTWHGVTIVAAVKYLESLGYMTFQLHPNGLRAVDVDYFGECGSANWLAFHEGSPEVGLKISSSD